MGCVTCYWLGMVRGAQSIPSRVQASWQVCMSGGHPHSVLLRCTGCGCLWVPNMKGKFDFCRLAPWWEDMRSRVQRKNTYAMVECVERCGIFRCCLALHEMTSVTSYHLDAGHARTKWPSLAAGTPYFFVSLGRVNVDCKKLVASHSRIPLPLHSHCMPLQQYTCTYIVLL